MAYMSTFVFVMIFCMRERTTEEKRDLLLIIMNTGASVCEFFLQKEVSNQKSQTYLGFVLTDGKLILL